MNRGVGTAETAKRVEIERLAAPLLVLLVAFGAVIRIVYAGQDLFADELSTYWIISTNGLGGVIDTVHSTAEITPPFSFVLSWLATRIDLSPEMFRLPALVGGIGTIPIVYWIGTRTVGRGAGLLAAAMTALSPFMIYYSAEARGYGLMMFLVAGSTLLLLLAVDRGGRGRWGWWGAYALFTCAAAYTHYTSIFVIAVQFAWVLWAHPRSRRSAVLAAAAAAVGFLPWITGLKGDLDSPTTEILSVLSPFDLESVRVSIEHWALGFPYSSTGGLGDLPGIPALVLLAAGFAVAAVAAATAAVPVREWYRTADHRLALIIALALATPIGEAIASAVGSNVFGTRNLAASWPYLGLAVAAMLTIGNRRLRLVASALVVVAFAIGTVTMLGSAYERPQYDAAARYIEDQGIGVVVDGSAITPGPLTNMDVSLSPQIADLRLNVPQERDHPFGFTDRRPVPATVGAQAAALVDGAPIAFVLGIDAEPPEEVLDQLPRGYRLTGERTFPGILSLKVLVYERTGSV